MVEEEFQELDGLLEKAARTVRGLSEVVSG